MRKNIAVVAIWMGLAGVCMAGSPYSSAAEVARPQDGWQKEFDEICSKTQDAMAFSVEELTSLVKRCDALEPQINKLDETRKKVFMGRLRMCRGLYAYVLESKKSDKK